jgi:hypothetical protein
VSPQNDIQALPGDLSRQNVLLSVRVDLNIVERSGTNSQQFLTDLKNWREQRSTLENAFSENSEAMKTINRVILIGDLAQESEDVRHAKSLPLHNDPQNIHYRAQESTFRKKSLFRREPMAGRPFLVLEFHIKLLY